MWKGEGGKRGGGGVFEEIFGRGRNEVYLIIPRTILKITTGKSEGNYCYNQKLFQLKKMWGRQSHRKIFWGGNFEKEMVKK